MADRYDMRWMMAGGEAILFIGSLASGLATSFEALLVARLVAGAGAAMFFTGSMVWVSKNVEMETRGWANAVYWGLGRSGNAAGAAVGGLVAVSLGVRAPFILSASLAGIGALFIAIRMNSEKQAQSTGRVLESVVASGSTSSRFEGFDRSFYFLSIVTFLYYGVSFGVIFALAPFYGYYNLRLDEPGVSLALAAATAAIVILMVPMGKWTDRHGRRSLYVASLILAGVSIIVLPLYQSFLWLVVIMAIFGFGVAASGFATAWAADLLRSRNIGFGLGVYRVILDAGFAAGPVGLSAIAAFTGASPSTGVPPTVFYVAGGLLLSAALLATRIRDPARSRKIEVEPEVRVVAK